MNIDPKILINIKKGDQTAFRKLVTSYHTMILNLTYSLIGNRDDSYDIVQQVFIKVWTKIDCFELNKNFTPWIIKITTNLCKDYWRSNSTKKTRNERYKRENFNKQEASEFTGFHEKKILSIINILSKKQKLVYILRDLQELAIADISAILNISKSSVKTNLFYARKNLHNHLIKINRDNNHEL